MPSTYEDRVQGISTSVAVKAPVRVATTANITLSGLQTLDGITVVADDRVLVKNQTDTVENGIYAAGTSTWVRSEDFDGSVDAVKGTRVSIIEGTVHAGEEWNLTTADTVVIGTSNIVWAQSPLQDAVDAAEAAQVAAEAAAASVTLPTISGGDAGKGIKVNAGETAYEFTAGAFGTAALLNVGTSPSEVVQLNGTAQLPAVDGSLLTNLAAGLPTGHLTGLNLSNDTDADHDILIATGQCRDGADSDDIVLAAAITKRIDASWSVGDDAGGLDGTESVAGTPDVSTTYHVWLIKRSDTDVVDALFSESATTPTMPTNYDIKRRIGAVITDGSANILAFSQLGDEFLLDAVVETSVSVSTTASSIAVKTPGGIQTWWLGFIYTVGSALTFITPLDVSDEVATSSKNQNIADTSIMSGPGIRTNTSSQVRGVSNVAPAGTTVVLGTRGWIDRRGRDG